MDVVYLPSIASRYQLSQPPHLVLGAGQSAGLVDEWEDSGQGGPHSLQPARRWYKVVGEEGDREKRG